MLSPILFGVYVDGMLEKRKDLGYGCKGGSKFCGGVGFADGLFLLTPTIFALKKIVNICVEYGNNLISNLMAERVKL